LQGKNRNSQYNCLKWIF